MYGGDERDGRGAQRHDVLHAIVVLDRLERAVRCNAERQRDGGKHNETANPEGRLQHGHELCRSRRKAATGRVVLQRLFTPSAAPNCSHARREVWSKSVRVSAAISSITRLSVAEVTAVEPEPRLRAAAEAEASRTPIPIRDGEATSCWKCAWLSEEREPDVVGQVRRRQVDAGVERRNPDAGSVEDADVG